MRQILQDNALEAWAFAIKFCNGIKEGKGTLLYQKNFISSLHNAVELFIKQMMINDGNHDVAYILKHKKEDILIDYNNALDLNAFFTNYEDEKNDVFKTISFEELKKNHKKIIKKALDKNENLTNELELLQYLRNNESHFSIHQENFLSEDNFCILHNFMIRFYKILEDWEPENGNGELSLLPYWGEPTEYDRRYYFVCDILQNFSYEESIKQSSIAKEIAVFLSDRCYYNEWDFAPYIIAQDFIEEKTVYKDRFDEIYALTHMMQIYKIITLEALEINELEETYFIVNTFM